MNQMATKSRTSRVNILKIGIITLTAITALIHLVLGIGLTMMSPSGRPPNAAAAAGNMRGPAGGNMGGAMGGLMTMFPTLFILNFVGYMVLVIALYLPALTRFQHITRWVLIGFTALTIVLWFIFEGSHADIMGYGDKAVEIALIVLLVIEERRSRAQERIG